MYSTWGMLPFCNLRRYQVGAHKVCATISCSSILLRLVLSGRQHSDFKVLTCCSLITAAILCIGSAVFNNLRLVLFYPVFVNALFFAIFFLSLYKGDAIITRFAKLTQKEGQLPDFAISYTRKVTVVWSLFLFLMALLRYIHPYQ